MVNGVCARAGVGIVRVRGRVRVQVGRNRNVTPGGVVGLLWRPASIVRSCETSCEYVWTQRQITHADFVDSSHIASVVVEVVANTRSQSRSRMQGMLRMMTAVTAIAL
jgi:hypothetical protein